MSAEFELTAQILLSPINGELLSAATSNHNLYYAQPDSFTPPGSYSNADFKYVLTPFLQLTRQSETAVGQFKSKFIFENQSETHGSILEEVW